MAIPVDYPKRRYADRLLRTLPSTDDDPDWGLLGIPPGVIIVTVSAVAAALDYTIQVDPLSADDLIPALVTATGVAADEDATAAALAAAVNAEIAAAQVAGVGQLSDYFDMATSVGPAVYLWVNSSAPTFGMTLNGPTALTAAPGEQWPTTIVTSNQRDYHTTQPGSNHLALAFVQVDSAGTPLPDSGALTFTIESARYVERIRRSDSDNANPRTPGVTTTETLVGFSVQDEYRVPFYGGRFGVRLSSIIGEHPDFRGLEVYYREIEQ
jgi:hypothetical protein